MRFPLFACIAVVTLFASCGNESKPPSTETTSIKSIAAAPESNLGKEATGELMNVLTNYYALKDALVATDAVRTDAAASKLLSAAENFKHNTGDKPEAKELHPQLQTVMTESEAIITAKADSIEIKRAHFSAVSDAMYKLLQLAGLRHSDVYQQYCPMALHDKGAYWLSAESEIKNPYFGKKMLECGEVRDSL